MIFLLKMMETINLELLEDQINYRLSEIDHKKNYFSEDINNL